MSPHKPRTYFPRRRRASLSGRFLQKLLQRFDIGRITMHLPDGETVDWTGHQPGPHGVLLLHRWRAVRRLVFSGRLGFAEAYVDGEWSSPDLATLIEYAALNQDSAQAALAGTRLHRLLARLKHLARANTKRGSKRNIVAHYDLGNEFYSAWLDRGMTYSSALFTEPGLSLERAQEAKQARVLAGLALQGGERVLEIGFGWGGLAERLINEARCHVTGLTLSPAQLRHAQDRLQQGGMDGRHDLRLQDYRDIKGVFDRIVCIEMLEAVGIDYWPVYFERLRECLAEGGRAVLQVITIAEQYCDGYRREPDFIQRHIFPGGMLPSVAELRAHIEQAGLVLQAAEHFGASYAATLREWQNRFQAAWPKLSFQGFDDRFKRKWEYYLAYCEAGFRAGSIDVGIYELTREACATG
jgi:cyclopropane-fatty-acyl-phospholipid synthase